MRRLLVGIALSVLSVLVAPAAFAATSPFRPTDPADPAMAGLDPAARMIAPHNPTVVELDVAAFEALVASAPAEALAPRGVEGVELVLPTADGEWRTLRLIDSPILEAPLAERYPEIRTFLLVDPTDPTIGGRADWTPHGFHAVVRTPSGRSYVDPWTPGDRVYYQVYRRADLTPGHDFHCAVEDETLLAPGEEPAGATLGGLDLRTYRTAIAATVEYTAFHGGTVPLGLAAITTALNRVNEVYEYDVAIRMILIANNSQLVYTSEPDPYTNNNGSTMLGQNQSNLDATIGSANYDIGHVFSTGGGGVATLNGPCNASTKARGVTGLSAPTGDPFYIDYVAHEMGHQWGAQHTFNGNAGACSGGNRSAGSAYEPGSGSTIMAYAGICGAQDLQPNSDAYFHLQSLLQIQNYSRVGSGNNCAAIVAQGNQPPSVDAGADYTIPVSTPFELFGSGSDPDGAIVGYGWEEWDLGPAGPPQTPTGTAPIFRSFDPTATPWRTFPKLEDLLDGTATIGEILPTYARNLRFRLVARDNGVPAGANGWDEALLTVTDTAGPFLVTAPNTSGVTWNGSGPHTVEWDVAGTTAAPVSCAAVDIALSTDGGQTFDIPLATDTPNDGDQQVLVTADDTTQARVRVKCHDNIFFDVSNQSFTITGAGAPTGSQLVISQVYGGGGNSGAPLDADFVELFNLGTTAEDLSGRSIQYASAAGSTWAVTALPSFSLAPGQSFLVRMSNPGANGSPLPTPDHIASPQIAMSGTNGKVALVDGTTSLTGTCPTTDILDFAGYGTANCFEGSAAIGALSNTTAGIRVDGGCTDTDQNGDDFDVTAPAPRNSASPITPCGGGGNPTVSINDVAAVEGNAGNSLFVFTVSVSGTPAGAVSMLATIHDGTATVADNDYVDQNNVALSIVPPATSTTFTVQVIGDTASEPNETFTVQLTDVVGADPGDLSGLGTIQNDDISLTAIHDIQGPGTSSPIVGATVTTSGVVTARKSNGLFIQAPDAEADADPQTSEGIFVFTSSAPPAGAVVGALLQVTGTVVEFVPAADALQPPMTELSSPTIVVLSSGNPLPAPVPLTVSFPDPAGPFDQMERVEGMRVSAASLTVVGGTLGSVNEPNATATTNGVLFATVTGHARPVREAGVQEPDPAPITVPRFDTNPESIRIDTDAGGHSAIDAGAGALLTGVIGPVDYAFRKYTIIPEAGAVIGVSGGPVATGVTSPAAGEVTIASYNLERFFDDFNDPDVGEPVLTPAAYEGRLARASLGIRDYLHAPDILGLVEVENLETLEDLAARISADALGAGQTDPLYAAYLVEGNDVGGIDVGFLVRTDDAGGVERVEVVEVVQELADTLFVNADASTELLNDRPPLRLEAVVHFADGGSWPVTVIVNHMRSLNGVASVEPGSNGWATVGDRVRAKRLAQAEDLALLVQDLQTDDPEANVVLIGDFNAFEVNDGLVHSMGVIAGVPVPDEETVVPGDGIDLVTPDFHFVGAGQYSFVFDGNAQSLDHALVGTPVFASTSDLRVEHARINADFPEVARNSPGTVERLSDHDPLVLYLTPQFDPVPEMPFLDDFETGDTSRWSSTVP